MSDKNQWHHLAVGRFPICEMGVGWFANLIDKVAGQVAVYCEYGTRKAAEKALAAIKEAIPETNIKVVKGQCPAVVENKKKRFIDKQTRKQTSSKQGKEPSQ